MKISEWLNNKIGSHGIYDHDELAKDFKEQTGFDANWPHYTERETADAIRRRGLGGGLTFGTSNRLAYGYVIAESLAKEHASYTPWQMGRGFRFNSCVEALVKVGK